MRSGRHFRADDLPRPPTSDEVRPAVERGGSLMESWVDLLRSQFGLVHGLVDTRLRARRGDGADPPWRSPVTPAADSARGPSTPRALSVKRLPRRPSFRSAVGLLECGNRNRP